MSVLLGWLSPVRAIFIWIDAIAFSLVDNVYDLFIRFAKSEVINLKVVKDLSTNIYILVAILAFFRLAVLLINSIISPDKLYEKKTGVGNLFTRLIGMLVALVLAPAFIFPALQEVQNFAIDNDVVQRMIMPSSGRQVNIGNAGKTMQKMVITSLIKPEERFFDEDFDDQETQVIAFINAEIPDDVKNGKKFLKGDTSSYGFMLGEECLDKSTCVKAMLQYHQVISDSHRGFNLARLAGYIGGSIDMENPEDPEADEEDVYYYEYIAILTTVTAIFLTYVILSWAIDIAVRSVELAVLRVISPLFIATIIDPKSTASGGYFNNFLKRYGKTYADLFIKLAIISFAILAISLVQDADIPNSLVVIPW